MPPSGPSNIHVFLLNKPEYFWGFVAFLRMFLGTVGMLLSDEASVEQEAEQEAEQAQRLNHKSLVKKYCDTYVLVGAC